jgi:hypothetical protein
MDREREREREREKKRGKIKISTILLPRNGRKENERKKEGIRKCFHTLENNTPCPGDDRNE